MWCKSNQDMTPLLLFHRIWKKLKNITSELGNFTKFLLFLTIIINQFNLSIIFTFVTKISWNYTTGVLFEFDPASIFRANWSYFFKAFYLWIWLDFDLLEHALCWRSYCRTDRPRPSLMEMPEIKNNFFWKLINFFG